MSTSKVVRSAGVAVGVVLILAACGKSSEVGSAVGAAGGGSGPGALRDAKATTTTAPLDIDNPGAPTTQAQQSAGIGQGSGSAAPKATTTTQADVTEDTEAATTTTTEPDEGFTVLIQDDTQGNFMQPLNLQVSNGDTVTWKNVSSKTRKLQASTGEFASPEIPAGSTFQWVVNAAPGTITYKDTTRPYATAQLQVA